MSYKLIARINVIAEFCPFRLFGLAMVAFVFEQMLLSMIEQLVWGERFIHWGDPAVLLLIFAFYVVCIHHMAPTIAQKWKVDLGWGDAQHTSVSDAPKKEQI